MHFLCSRRVNQQANNWHWYIHVHALNWNMWLFLTLIQQNAISTSLYSRRLHIYKLLLLSIVLICIFIVTHMTNIFYNVTICNIINLTDEREKNFIRMQRLSSKIEIVFDSKCIWTAEMSETSAWSQKSRRSSVWKHDITDVHNHKNKNKKY